MNSMHRKISIIFTDLDGTLLDSDRNVSEINLSCLHELGERDIVRVIATGRSCFSFRKVINNDFPADYLIFSSGAGILNLQTTELIYSANLQTEDIKYISGQLKHQKVDFMVHHKVPENHRFVYHSTDRGNADFNRRIEIYREFGDNFTETGTNPDPAAQIIAIFPDDVEKFTAVKKHLNGYQITRTTSPLDGRSIWMEIHPKDVNKGSAASRLCHHLDIDHHHTFGIGNDYNDIDLLNFTSYSYLVANGPDELKRHYRQAKSNNEDGFFHAILEAREKQ